MKNSYVNGKSIPRWIILILDLVIICCSFTFSYFIISEFDFQKMTRGHFLIYIGLLLLLSLPIIYLRKMHTGLLRYSNTSDMLRVFNTVLIITILFSLISFPLSFRYYHFPHLIGLIIINFFITTCVMILMRVMGRSVFYTLVRRSNNNKTIKVLIFGSDKNAILVKKALENSDKETYDIEGFIDMNREHINSYMEQTRVYHIRDLKEIQNQKQIDQLVIVNEDLGEDTKRVLVDRCLQYGIKVITVPPVQSWLNNGLGKKQIKELRIEDLLQRKPILMDPKAVNEGLKDKRILITGAAGSIGSEIANQVLDYNPAMVILCDQAESPLYEIQMELMEVFPNSNFQIVIGDVRNYKRMDKVFDTYKPEIVFHAAAYKHVPLMESNPFEAILVNIHGTKNIADLSIIHKVKKFVMISTDKAVNPTNVMGASKRIAEIYIQSLNDNQKHFREIHGVPNYNRRTRFITTRFGNVLGSNGSVIPRFRSQIEKGGPITVTHPDITRYFMTISEAVQLVLEAGIMGTGGEIFIFDMGSPVKIYDMAKKMIQLAGLELGKDIEIVFSGLRPGEKLYEELLNTSETTMPTYHDKIKIAHVRTYTYSEVNSAIDNLMKIEAMQDDTEIVKQMKLLVPEFISQNSIYEEIDLMLSNDTENQTTFPV